MPKLQEFEKLFWEQYFIDGIVVFDEKFVIELIEEIFPSYYLGAIHAPLKAPQPPLPLIRKTRRSQSI